MKIALLGPIAWRTPPRAYGPWEQVVSLLAEGLGRARRRRHPLRDPRLADQGHLDGVCPQPYNEDPDLDGRVWEALHVAHCLARSGEFDLVHNNVDWLPLAMSHLCSAPMVTTVHGFSDPQHPARVPTVTSAFVSISDADRASRSRLRGRPCTTAWTWVRFPFGEGASGTLVAFGPHPSGQGDGGRDRDRPPGGVAAAHLRSGA
jgi:hypothetical protein